MRPSVVGEVAMGLKIKHTAPDEKALKGNTKSVGWKLKLQGILSTDCECSGEFHRDHTPFTLFGSSWLCHSILIVVITP